MGRSCNHRGRQPPLEQGGGQEEIATSLSDLLLVSPPWPTPSSGSQRGREQPAGVKEVREWIWGRKDANGASPA